MNFYKNMEKAFTWTIVQVNTVEFLSTSCYPIECRKVRYVDIHILPYSVILPAIRTYRIQKRF